MSKHLREITSLVVTTHWDCGENGCNGEMLPESGETGQTGEIVRHACTACHRVDFADRRYPHAVIQPVRHS